MTTSISLDQSVHVRQSLSELTYRSGVLCQHIDELKEQTEKQLTQLQTHFTKAQQLRGAGVVPFYDSDNLYQFIAQRLSKFNTSMDNLSEEKRRFELVLRNYESTVRTLIQEVNHA